MKGRYHFVYPGVDCGVILSIWQHKVGFIMSVLFRLRSG